MNQKERDTQRALGNIEVFRVTVTIPIKVNVSMIQNVEAVSEEDAIEKMKMIHDIIPDNELLRDAVSKVKSFNSKAEFDVSIDREYTTRAPYNTGDDCDSGACESSS